jgi:hypothetical protein
MKLWGLSLSDRRPPVNLVMNFLGPLEAGGFLRRATLGTIRRAMLHVINSYIMLCAEKSTNCSRPCLDGEKAKECYFKFVLEPLLTVDR